MLRFSVWVTFHSSPVCCSVWVGLCHRLGLGPIWLPLRVGEEGTVGVSAAGHGPGLASGATSQD